MSQLFPLQLLRTMIFYGIAFFKNKFFLERTILVKMCFTML